MQFRYYTVEIIKIDGKNPFLLFEFVTGIDNLADDNVKRSGAVGIRQVEVDSINS